MIFSPLYDNFLVCFKILFSTEFYIIHMYIINIYYFIKSIPLKHILQRNDGVVDGRPRVTAAGDGRNWTITGRSIIELAYEKTPNEIVTSAIYGRAYPPEWHGGPDTGTTSLTPSRYPGVRPPSSDARPRVVSAAGDRLAGYRVGVFVGTIQFGNTTLPVFDLTCRPNGEYVQPNNGRTVPPQLGKLYRFPVRRSWFDAGPLGRPPPDGRRGTACPRFTVAPVQTTRLRWTAIGDRHPDPVPDRGLVAVERKSSVHPNNPFPTHAPFCVVITITERFSIKNA